MTTFETAMAWTGQKLQVVAKNRTARRRTGQLPWYWVMWQLLSLLGSLALFTYGAWTLAHWAGYFVGAASLLVARTMIVKGGDKREGS